MEKFKMWLKKKLEYCTFCRNIYSSLGQSRCESLADATNHFYRFIELKN